MSALSFLPLLPPALPYPLPSQPLAGPGCLPWLSVKELCQCTCAQVGLHANETHHHAVLQTHKSWSADQTCALLCSVSTQSLWLGMAGSCNALCTRSLSKHHLSRAQRTTTVAKKYNYNCNEGETALASMATRYLFMFALKYQGNSQKHKKQNIIPRSISQPPRLHGQPGARRSV